MISYDSDIFLKKLGERIVVLRKAQGKSQRDLAFDINWEKENLRKIENGRTNPTTKTLLKICSALEITMTELFDFEINTNNDLSTE